MKLVNFCNRIIEYSFYTLFFLVPLVFTSDTSELFEFNKMWLTFGISIIIGTSWIVKSIILKQIRIQKTPLDIPIGLFLLSQIISTFLSLDMHVSLWGYYSRFNGGLYSIITYIILYYAFVSNLAEFKYVFRAIFASLLSGIVVALWGLPSHFGYDPTCLMFRGTFDVSCWTADFQPKIRIFSSMGQPDWLAAYLTILLPVSAALFVNKITSIEENLRKRFSILNFNFPISKKSFLLSIFYLLSFVLFYLDLIYTGSRSGVLAAWISLTFLGVLYLWSDRKKIKELRIKELAKKHKPGLTIFALILITTFIVGQPISQLDKLTLPGLRSALEKVTAKQAPPQVQPKPFAGEMGGTDSGKIRLIVWEGALNTWRNNFLFGTGVETFAFAYYRYRLPAHNLTSEWNFLYNKAHNEYLNYLATTGTFGLGTYLSMIFVFFYVVFKTFKSKVADLKSESQNFKLLTLTLAILAGYISILITNFFGFSVVIVNIYLFLIPSFVLILLGKLNLEKAFIFGKKIVFDPKKNNQDPKISFFQWIFMILVIVAAIYKLSVLITYWNADRSYALGHNLDQAGSYEQAFPFLKNAVKQMDSEPVYKDEFSINNAVLAVTLLSQREKQGSTSAQLAQKLAQNAVSYSNAIITEHPNNFVFWKTRVRVLYTLSQIDPRYLPLALDAIIKTRELAPTDANIAYNMGILYGQNEDIDKAIQMLENAVALKPDYREAYYALGIFYRQKATDKKGNIINPAYNQKAIAQMKFILDRISTTDAQAKSAITSWGK